MHLGSIFRFRGECWNANEKVAYTASGKLQRNGFFLYLEISLSSVVSRNNACKVHRKHLLLLQAHEYHGYRAMGGSVGSGSKCQDLKCNYVFVPGC